MAKIHDYKEFRQLVEVTGPFLSTTILKRTFPQGFPKVDGEGDLRRGLREEYDEWSDAMASAFDAVAHRQWLRYVLADVLGWPADAVAEGQAVPQTLHGDAGGPDLVLMTLAEEDFAGNRSPQLPFLLVQFYDAQQGLNRANPKSRARLTPVDRMTALLRGTGQRLGLVSNGEQWTIVYAPDGGVTSTATWYAEIWLEEPVTLRAFRALLDAHRFYSAAEPLVKMLEESALNQHEVTNQLGRQVREAVEILVRALDRADRDRGRVLLTGVPDTDLYEAAISVMMRLVFLFSAEEKGLLLLNEEIYDSYYAVSTLGDQLRTLSDQFGEELLERRQDAWARLLASFRAVHSGLEHDRLQLPAYGGQLFDPDRYPFLEGRAAGTHWRETGALPLPLNNRTVLHLLNALQILQEKGNEPRRLTFRELDIEQIGHVYESLLDHTARRDQETVLGLAGDEPEIRLSVLEDRRSAGGAALVSYLKDETGKSEPAIRRALDTAADARTQDRIHAACGGDEVLAARVLPFAGLIRDDSFGVPLVILPGSVYVTQGADRRSTGTHYTPRSLTEPIVQYTLEPLVYEGPAEGSPRDTWQLRSAGGLLDLNICDMACGSGAFLVQACRYLSERLLEAWSAAEEAHPGVPGITPEGHESTGAPQEELIPIDPDERKAYALRTVAQRCLYGVDKNPLAAEMTKLSLWLLTLAKGKPFTFLDHAIKSGDSLVGVDKQQLLAFRLDGQGDPQGHLFTLSDRLAQVAHQRGIIGAQRVSTIADVERLAFLLAGAEAQTSPLRAIGDVLVGIAFLDAKPAERERIRDLEDQELPMLLAMKDSAELEERAARYRNGLRPFHWPLAFPEVFEERGGFDAFIGNPPFIGGQKITGILGKPYREYLVENLAAGQRGSADYSAYFFLRARQLLRTEGCFGLLATNTIAQGDTREVGLDQVIADCTLMRAIPSSKWPGEANLEVAHVWGRKATWQGPHFIGDEPVAAITALLTPPGTTTGNPFRLEANAGKSFQGSNVLGLGFAMTPGEAQELIARDPRNAGVLFPYLNGEDLNSRPNQSASRWVINFRDWPLAREAPGNWDRADEKARKEWLRSGLVPSDYPDPVAADYPDCLDIVGTKVKPDRDRLAGGDATARDRARRWWQFARPTKELYATIASLDRVLVRSAVSAINSMAFVSPMQVFSHALVVFASASPDMFAWLQSSFHLEWIHQYASSMRTDIRYTPTDCCETFPFPGHGEGITQVGNRYHDARLNVLAVKGTGLTELYKALHSPGGPSTVKELRDLQVEMDESVKQAYGWTFPLDHGFHETKQGVRFTLSPKARETALDLLLQLNHQRHAEEVENSAAKKTPTTKGPRKRVVAAQGSLL